VDRNSTILVAEDDENDVLFLTRALRRIPIENPLQICSDGEQVIKYLKGEPPFSDRVTYPFPVVLFLDIKMPKVSGLEVLRWLNEHPDCSVIPTIVFTSSRLESDVRMAYKLGANSYIVKTPSFDELQKLIKVVCEYWGRCERPPLPTHC
jgi:CheY-like chemotaxis protein